MPSTDRTAELQQGNKMELRPKEREIYEAAARIFYEKGYAATSNQEIADEVGILKGSLYYYIDTKEDLLFGVIKMAYSSLSDHLVRCQNLEVEPIERLRHFVVGHTKLVIDNLVSVGVLERDLRALSDPRRREVIEWRDGYERFLREMLIAGKEAGQIRASVDVTVESILIFTQMHGLHTWYSPDGKKSPEEIARLIADFVIEGVGTHDA